MRNTDPTRIEIFIDPLQERMRGVTVHGNMPFDVPYITPILDNLWVGGVRHGLVLPPYIKHVISLYPWERYTITHEDIKSESYYYMYDAGVPDESILERIVENISACVEDAPTLVHCQAGLNRSALVTALYLIEKRWDEPEDAVSLLRGARSPAVLCNKNFERYILGEE